MSANRTAFAIRSLSCALLLSGMAACAPSPTSLGPGSADGHQITAADVSRLGGSTAWRVLEQSGVPLSAGPSAATSPAQLTRRGMGSPHLDGGPLLILDGVRTNGLDLLHQIPSRDIEHIQVLSGIEASVRYGVKAGGGAIVLRTRTGASGAPA